jgi:hypothetical protein
MLKGLFDSQDWSKTDIASLKQAAPMIARKACEQTREPSFEAGPPIAIVLGGRIDVVELQFLQK